MIIELQLGRERWSHWSEWRSIPWESRWGLILTCVTGSPEAMFSEDEGCLTILGGISVRADVWWSNAILYTDAGLWRAANGKEPWSLISNACFQLGPLNCSALGLKAIKNIWALQTWNQALKYFHPLLKINFPYLLARRKCNPLWRKTALSRTSAISHMCLYSIP